MIDVLEDEVTEPLQTGRPILSRNLNITALVLYGIAGATVALMTAEPALVPKVWIWAIIGGAFVVGGICVIVSLNVRPQLTTAGKIIEIDQTMAGLAEQRAKLAGVDPPMTLAEAAGPPVHLDAADRAAIENLVAQVRAEGFEVPEPRKPSPHPRHTVPSGV